MKRCYQLVLASNATCANMARPALPNLKRKKVITRYKLHWWCSTEGLTAADNHHDRTSKHTGNTSSSDSSTNDKSGTTLRRSTYQRSRCKAISQAGSLQSTETHPSSKMPIVTRKTALICAVSAHVDKLSYDANDKHRIERRPVQS